ncbi:MAG TPA: hypothetical protein VGH80_08525 [Xanthomonadaceae bacterium]
MPSSFVAVLLLAAGGCATTPPPPPPPPAVYVPPPVSDFIIDAGMLDTWNAVGEILVRLDGVSYQGRSQMMGLYDLKFRGERFLVFTRAMTMTKPTDVISTQVRVATPDGKPDDSPAATDLLEMVHDRLPAELQLIAAGGRGKPTILGAPTTKKKKLRKQK